MTCEECEQIVLDSGRGVSRKGWMLGVSMLNLAESHAQNCPSCAAKMAGIANVNKLLGQLRLSTTHLEAPAIVETNLVAEFRRRRAMRVPAFTTFHRRFVWGLAAALIVIAAAAILYPSLRSQPPGAVRTQKIEKERPVQKLLSVSPDTTAVQAATENQRQNKRPKGMIPKGDVSDLRRPMQEGTRQPSLVPLGEDFALNGGGNIVRVSLPFSDLVAMGVPVHPDMLDRRVTADVAMDPFGAVIAVHVVERKSIAD